MKDFTLCTYLQSFYTISLQIFLAVAMGDFWRFPKGFQDTCVWDKEYRAEF